jgi:hypothetical protein
LECRKDEQHVECSVDRRVVVVAAAVVDTSLTAVVAAAVVDTSLAAVDVVDDAFAAVDEVVAAAVVDTSLVAVVAAAVVDTSLADAAVVDKPVVEELV